MEIEAVDEGVVEQLLFKEGDQAIAVNSPIAILSNSNIKKDLKNKNGNVTYKIKIRI